MGKIDKMKIWKNGCNENGKTQWIYGHVLPKDGDLVIYCIGERSEVGMLDTGKNTVEKHSQAL